MCARFVDYGLVRYRRAKIARIILTGGRESGIIAVCTIESLTTCWSPGTIHTARPGAVPPQGDERSRCVHTPGRAFFRRHRHAKSRHQEVGPVNPKGGTGLLAVANSVGARSSGSRCHDPWRGAEGGTAMTRDTTPNIIDLTRAPELRELHNICTQLPPSCWQPLADDLRAWLPRLWEIYQGQRRGD